MFATRSPDAYIYLNTRVFVSVIGRFSSPSQYWLSGRTERDFFAVFASLPFTRHRVNICKPHERVGCSRAVFNTRCSLVTCVPRAAAFISRYLSSDREVERVPIRKLSTDISNVSNANSPITRRRAYIYCVAFSDLTAGEAGNAY